ncbi:Serine/threonine-protein kinase tel1 [Serendipita sp. 396]|nr:Serine/threonine-protein kinase tel1 [Serendipita sp. 396]
MRRELRQAVEFLREGKVTERKRAIDDITQWFTSSNSIAKIGGNCDEWVEIFDAFGVAAKHEHEAVKKKVRAKGTESNLSKLEKLSAAFRIVVESSIPHLNNTALETLVPALVYVMKLPHGLEEGIGPNYARALLGITSYPPHVRSFTDKIWLSVSRLAWAVLFEDKATGPASWIEDDPKIKGTPTFDASQETVASSVQLLFATVIRHLCESPFAPLIEREIVRPDPGEDMPQEAKWAYYLLVKFCRYFETYAVSATSHVDMIPALYHLLERVELNRIADMIWFSRKIWSRLVTLMKGRVRSDHAYLLVILKILLPYYIHNSFENLNADTTQDSLDSGSSSGLRELAKFIDQSAPLKSGIDCLSLESLRLEFSPEGENTSTGFRATTFQYGPAFTASQAHTWVVLELQSDLLFNAYRIDEANPPSRVSGDGPPTKKVHLENSIQHLLSDLRTSDILDQRLFRLQCLLFLIDRHWNLIDSAQQANVSTNLLQILGASELLDTFGFLCLAALAAGSQQQRNLPSGYWENAWAHGYRSLNSSPSACRAASHLLNALLFWNRVEKSVVNRYIDQFATDFRNAEDWFAQSRKDDNMPNMGQLFASQMSQFAPTLSRQTVTFPTITEASCALLSRMITIADADAFLCQLHLEASARTWLQGSLSRAFTSGTPLSQMIRPGKISKDTEKLRKSASKLDSHFNAQDILGLLQAICSLTTKPTLRCSTPLPDDSLIKAILAYQSDRILRGFVIDATIPSFSRIDYRLQDGTTDSKTAGLDISTGSSYLRGDFPPQPREANVESMLASIVRQMTIQEPGASEDEQNSEDHRQILVTSSEKAVLVTRICAAGLGLQASLEVNGTRANMDLYRQIIGAISKAAPWSVSTPLPDIPGGPHWLSIVYELRCLAWMGRSNYPRSDPLSQFLLRPASGSGIRRESLRALSPDPIILRHKEEDDASVKLLNTIWRQKAASEFAEIIKARLCQLLESFSEKWSHIFAVNGQEHTSNDFPHFDGPANKQGAFDVRDGSDKSFPAISLAIIATSVMARNVEKAPTIWAEQLLANSEGNAFLLVGRAYCDCLRNGTLHASPNSSKSIISTVLQKLKTWGLWRSEDMHDLTLRLLGALAPVWVQEQGDVKGLVQKLLLRWVDKKIIDGGSWWSRYALAAFLDDDFQADPMGAWWKEGGRDDSMEVDDPDSQNGGPLEYLGGLLADGDIRVRHLSGFVYSLIFQRADSMKLDPRLLYGKDLAAKLPSDPTWFEGMLNRFIVLSNVMIASSPVRRGAYWHLIEVTLEAPHLTRYVVALLKCISTRLGFSGQQELYSAFAEQLAVQVHLNSGDFLQIPPRVLGFRNHKECADASFGVVVPVMIMAREASSYLTSARQDPFFIRYCKASQKSPDRALKECFPRLVAYAVVFHENTQSAPDNSAALKEWILQCAKDCGADNPMEYVRVRADQIAAAILCYLADIGYEPDGPIAEGLRNLRPKDGQDIVNIFSEMNKFRRIDDFRMHDVNYPVATTTTILTSIGAFTSFLGLDSDSGLSMVYHTTHNLFSAVHLNPLVNEQLRYMQSLSLWLAMSAGIADPPFIHMLLTDSFALLQQEDLIHGAQSIASWALAQLRRLQPRSDDIDLGILVTRIADLSVQYSQSSETYTAQIGRELLDWIEEELLLLSQVPSLLKRMQLISTLWPRKITHHPRPSPGFDRSGDSQAINALLQGDHQLLGRFRLTKSLSSLERYDPSLFATVHFWSLKEHIPDSRSLLPDDTDAFLELLYRCSGQFHSIGREVSEDRSLARRHRLEYETRDRDDLEPPIKAIIVKWLFQELTFTKPHCLHIIHRTLRLLCHPDCGDMSSVGDKMLFLFIEGAMEPLQANSINLSELKEGLYSSRSSDFTSWIKTTSILLARLLSSKDLFYAQLESLLTAETNFPTNLLPILVHQALLRDCEESQSTRLRPILSSFFSEAIRSRDSDILVRQSILDIIVHLRTFEHPGNDPVGYDKWLDFDFLDLCKASLACGSYTTALLFLELDAEYQGNHVADRDWEQKREDVLYEVYRHINEPDGFYAIKGRDIRRHLMHKFHHEGKWDKAFQSHVSNFEGQQVSAVNSQSQDLSGVIQSLYSFGFNHLALTLTRNTSTKTSIDTMYSLAWRTGAWDLPQPSDLTSRDCNLYSVMRSIHRGRDLSATNRICDRVIRHEIQQLRIANSENVLEMRTAIDSLLCLREVRQWIQDYQRERLQPPSPSSEWYKRLSHLSTELDFSTAEAIVATRVSLSHSLRASVSLNQIGNMDGRAIDDLHSLEGQCLVNLAINARKANKPQVAFNAVLQAQQIVPKGTFYISREFAEALWTQQEHSMAIQYLEAFRGTRFEDIKASKAMKLSTEERQEWAMLHGRLGRWISSARSANPQEIRDRYFDTAFRLLESLGAATNRRPAKMVYYHYADFANKHLRQMEESEESKRQHEWVKKVDDEVKQLDKGSKSAGSQSERDELRRRRDKTEILLKKDKEILEKRHEAVAAFFQQAISMYAHYMEVSDEHDEEVAVRFCGLWFSYFDSEMSGESIRYALQRISTHKLLFLSHQLTARLGARWQNEGRRNQKYLNQLVEAMCTQHPYHSMMQVLTMKGIEGLPRRNRGDEQATEIHIRRRDEAKKIIETVKSTLTNDPGKYGRPDGFVDLMETTLVVYIEWAEYPIKEMKYKPGQTISIPKAVRLHRLVWDMKGKQPPPLRVPVATAEIPIDLTGKYNTVATIQYYLPSYKVAGGVNVPKINTCVDTIGKSHRQLFKGEGADDLRQDAVMEQVFQLINILLSQDRESKRRSLSLRIYKVIPLPRKNGLIQFLSNTETMANFLPAYHQKYRPEDLTFRDAQNILAKVSKSPQVEDKINAFRQACSKFHPVLRHFFTAASKNPATWFSRRLTYSRSVATGSIAGHILGLGDRHLSNLLMDAKSGELIHIDLGIAFDQGKHLPIPELVPFRLTRDIVDGMGIAGTEGVFRRCSEETLRVLREGSDIIKTVLEVFKYDPLHNWTVPQSKLRRMQDLDDSESNSVNSSTLDPAGQGAERAIKSVTQKLDASLSVEYTVNDLIIAASDPHNLALIYYGWAPQC